MKRTFKGITLFFMIAGSCSFIIGQDLKIANVDLDHIYNDWAFSALESKGGLLIYREKADFFVNNMRYRSGVRFKFTKAEDVFLLKYNNGKVFKWCGNDRRKNSPPSWTKGKWQLLVEDENVVLELQYYVAVNGGKYKLTTYELYEMVHLEKDKMILRKLENEI